MEKMTSNHPVPIANVTSASMRLDKRGYADIHQMASPAIQGSPPHKTDRITATLCMVTGRYKHTLYFQSNIDSLARK